MDKWTFKNILQKEGYAVDSKADIPTVLMVGASSNEIKKKFYEVKLLANKYKYTHSIAVNNLKEEGESDV